MILTEEMIKSLPVITEEEMNEFCTFEELVADAISMFNEDVRKILTEEIPRRFPDLVMEFVEENEATHRTYPVDLYFGEIKYTDD
ncbi:MAG: hypothetical protein IKV15_07175 [Bacteroidaceae bacterium]|nr:hypothetical protein [Bacteroidaceae bacterium]